MNRTDTDGNAGQNIGFEERAEVDGVGIDGGADDGTAADDDVDADEHEDEADDEYDYEDDDDDDRCAICNASMSDCGEDHLVLALDREDGPLGGALYFQWNDLADEVRRVVFDALTKDAPRTGRGVFADGLFARLRKDGFRWQEHVDEPEDVDDDPDPEQAWDAFTDHWLDHYQGEVVAHMVEVLERTPGVVSQSFDVSTGPGVSWFGENYFAEDPEAAAAAFISALKGGDR